MLPLQPIIGIALSGETIAENRHSESQPYNSPSLQINDGHRQAHRPISRHIRQSASVPQGIGLARLDFILREQTTER